MSATSRIRDFTRPDFLYNFFFYRKLQGMLGGADALVLIPYSDKQLVPKRGNFHKHLVGNLPGYETDDGDVFVAPGNVGDPLYNFQGVPVVMALNPSEHAAVIEPLKSLIAHKRLDEEYVRVDRNGETVEVGQAIERADGGSVNIAENNPSEPNYEVYEGLFDLSPPVLKDPETGEPVGQADGYIVDQSKVAELIPSKTTSGELALMQQRERNAAMQTTQALIYLLYGAVAASVLWIIFMVILAIATGNAPSVV